MRFLFRAAPLALVMSLGASSAVAQGAPAPAGPRVAFIDSKVILSRAPGRQEAEALFDREMSTFRQQVQRMGDSLNAMIARYDSQEVSLSPAAKAERQKQIREREQAYQQRTQQLEQQAAQRQDELMRPIMEQVKKALDDIRQEDGYVAILDLSSGVVVAWDKNLDITERVISRLGTMKPAAKATPQRPTGAPAQAPAGVTRRNPPTQ